MEQGKVFISSILDAVLEDLHAERLVAKEVVTSYGFLKPWAFENAPASPEDLRESYLRHVDECDLFIVIVGTKATDPVAAECQRAREQHKPVLLFARESVERTPLAKALLASAGVKYAPFRTLDELRQCIKEAIDQALVSGLRVLNDRTVSRSTFDELQLLLEMGTQVHVRPIVPADAGQHMFRLLEVTPEIVTLEKISSHDMLNIPRARISEVLHFGATSPPVIRLDGRLQWITTTESWGFFEDEPDPASPLGFSKDSSIADPRAREIIERQEKQGFKFNWLRPEHFGLIRENAAVVYDDDGRYFKIRDRTGDLVLFRQRRT